MQVVAAALHRSFSSFLSLQLPTSCAQPNSSSQRHKRGADSVTERALPHPQQLATIAWQHEMPALMDLRVVELRSHPAPTGSDVTKMKKTSVLLLTRCSQTVPPFFCLHCEHIGSLLAHLQHGQLAGHLRLTGMDSR